MTFKEEMEKEGERLYKWRSYIPLLFLLLLPIALKNYEFIERTFGDRIGDLWEGIAFIISFLGFIVRCFTVGYIPKNTSGRTNSLIAERLNTTGMYSIVRHPLYLGNFLIVFGIVLFIQVLWFGIIVLAGYWFYYERIIFAEEEFLRKRFGDEFISWAERTPMIIPNFKNWRRPVLPFSFKTVLRREFTTFFAMTGTYYFLEITEDSFIEKDLSERNLWLICFLLGITIYSILVILKRKTRILNVSGR